MTPLEWLRQNGAQGDVLDGLQRFHDWRSLWVECPRGDWLLGIASRLGVDHVLLVRAALECARLVDRTALSNPAAVDEVLSVVARWVEGEATVEDVAAATRTLEASPPPSTATGDAAGRAVLAVGLGVCDPEVLVMAAAAVAESVIVSAMDCGLELAMRWAHDQCASRVRGAIEWSQVERRVMQLDDETGAELDRPKPGGSSQ